ncbi:hypothetical protein O7634_22165 [Micromonospora sp. WMMD1120]|uniref:hypothetical protein n=1 Tax=Micromonospora sp. WMMD1120 TaxID=3016106 RepID=UPI002415B17E|nr:hypothetical protein [Micromonospora sp. WMMD1120]MDG4809461.1 hypothetical protein [Micromonospora sp. WMMD1120]
MTVLLLEEAVARLSRTPPAALYAAADRFEDRRQTFAELADRLRRALRDAEDAYRSIRPTSSVPASSAHVAAVLDQLAATDFASALRRAGDSLADARDRLGELVARQAVDPQTRPNTYDVQGQVVLSSAGAALLRAGQDLPPPPPVTATGRELTGSAPPGVELFASDLDPDRDVPPSPPGGASPGAGAPMMPMMPMHGMGMGAVGAHQRDRRVVVPAPVDPGPWAEPSDGWGTPGRGRPSTPVRPERSP